MSEEKPEVPGAGDEGVQHNPQTGFPVPSDYRPQQPPPPPPLPPTAQPPYGQAPYGQPSYGQPPYGQSPYGQAPYDPTQPYPQGYPMQPYLGYPAYAIPEHPQAGTAMVLGLISLAGAFMCILPILVAPFAWVIGYKARKAIQREPQRYGGESKATAGMVMGIIGTVLLILAVVAVIIAIVVAATSGPSSDPFNTNV